MLMRLVLLGSGSDLDPHHADLPVYNTLAVDALNGAITVSVSPRQNPPQSPPPGPPHWVVENGANVLISMPESMVLAWWQQLAKLYPSRSPSYQPAFAQ